MSTTTRDLRLDFFRGLSLLMIFINHVPGNGFAHFTLARFTFNDAAEVFVFISGYTAALVFYRRAASNGNLHAVIQLLRRCWTLYIAHIFLFVVYFVVVAHAAEQFSHPFLAEGKLDEVLREPHTAILNALLIRYQPHYFDILPLYIVALVGFAALLPLLSKHIKTALVVSLSLYLAVTLFNIGVPAYPEGERWMLNPLAWQVLFVIGAVCASKAGTNLLDGFYRKWVFRSVAACLVICVVAHLLIKFWPGLLAAGFIEWTERFGFKVDLGPIRLVNFLTLAIVVTRFVPKESPLLRMRLARPLLLCGQHSLYIFCLGIILAFLGHVFLLTISTDRWAQTVVCGGGIAILIATASALEWAKERTRRVTPPAAAKLQVARG